MGTNPKNPTLNATTIKLALNMVAEVMVVEEAVVVEEAAETMDNVKEGVVRAIEYAVYQQNDIHP
jgi:hypothetical protein